MMKRPSGLCQSEASFARNLFGATPADAVRFNSSRICFRMAIATRVAVGRPALFSLTSRYASSSDAGSIKSVYRLKISIAIREAVRYRAKSGGTKIAPGQSRSAETAGIAERTPKRLASYDAAQTTERFPRQATM